MSTSFMNSESTSAASCECNKHYHCDPYGEKVPSYLLTNDYIVPKTGYGPIDDPLS